MELKFISIYKWKQLKDRIFKGPAARIHWTHQLISGDPGIRLGQGGSGGSHAATSGQDTGGREGAAIREVSCPRRAGEEHSFSHMEMPPRSWLTGGGVAAGPGWSLVPLTLRLPLLLLLFWSVRAGQALQTMDAHRCCGLEGWSHIRSLLRQWGRETPSWPSWPTTLLP